LSAAALNGAEFAFEFPEPADDLTSAEARRAALQSRSDILTALADYAAAEAGLRLQIAKQFPDVHFNPGYQFDQGDNKWSLGISVELPVLNQNQGPIAEAQARRRLAAAKFTALQAQVIGEIDRAVAGWHATRGQKKTGDAVLAASQKQIQSVQAQVQTGAADQLDLLNSFLESNGASLVQLENEARLQRAVSALEDAVHRPMDAMESSLIEQPSAQARKENKP
jgi:outer membrane protein TolC